MITKLHAEDHTNDSNRPFSYLSSAGSTQGQNKASHFHCSKCDFVCTDTNKVVAHRRQHQKLDSIMAAGFEKFTPSQHCHVGNLHCDNDN